MAELSEKDIEHARHIENTSKPSGSDASLSQENGTLQTLDDPEFQDDDVFIDLPEAERKRVLRKVDWRLVCRRECSGDGHAER
jgi:hypothetical protein